MNERQQEVTEFQGFYGPFTVTEKLLQKIWLRGDFNAPAAKTVDGKSVEVLFPGKWNLLEGPDFKNARLRIGGRAVTGDVELHFEVADWFKHRHHLDPAYNDVVLHVLLFRPHPEEAPESAAVTSAGQTMPVMPLLELLHHDLEEYAGEDAIEATLKRDHWQAAEQLVALPLDERRQLLGRHARERWAQKVHFARVRVKKLGWAEACHQTVLEILGYRRNRGAMLNVATRYPFAGWRSPLPGEEALLRGSRWIVQGARPANRPRTRLRQYLKMVEERPDWPERLREAYASIEGAAFSEFAAGWFRSERKLKALREEWADKLTGGAIGGTRLDTLFCDGFFPLAAADGGGDERFFPYWFSWYAGDFPERVTQTLRTADITDRRRFVACNGFCQGVLSLSLRNHDDPLVCFEDVQEQKGCGEPRESPGVRSGVPRGEAENKV